MKYLILIIMIIGFAGCNVVKINTAYECKQSGWKGVVNYAYIDNHDWAQEQYCSNGEIINKAFVTNQGQMPLLSDDFKAIYIEFK